MKLMTRFFKEEEGQGLTEYALIIALVSICLVVALGIFKDKIAAVFNTISTKFGV